MKAGIPGTERRRPASAAPTKPATNNNPPRPPPPAPEPTVHQRFTKELTLILIGKKSEPGELYCPLSKLDPEQHRAICIVDDSITRELFSFSQKLAEQYRRVPVAKNASEVDKMRHAEAVFKRQVEAVRELMYQHMCAANPELADLDRPLELLEGWVAASVTSRSDRLHEVLSDMSRTFGLPPGLVERIARDTREES